MLTFVVWDRRRSWVPHLIQECCCGACGPTREIAEALLGWLRFGQQQPEVADGYELIYWPPKDN